MQPSPKHIHIVEDATEIQILLADLLIMEGYQVSASSNGQEALDYLNQTAKLPDLILLDLMMPVMDGYGFRKNQQSNDKISKIPIVVMSADRDIRIKQSELKATDYLRKPVEVSNLLDTVKRLCH